VADGLLLTLREMDFMPDHMHVLMDVDPQYGVHRAVTQFKGRSSRVVRAEFPWLRSRLPTRWTNSYFAAPVGGAPLEIVKQHIKNQNRSESR